MGKSIAFAGMRADVLAIARCIPPGRVTTFGDIGAFMTVMPRHVAYILSQLSPQEQDDIPWYRVVGAVGKLGKAKFNAMGESQATLLADEGVAVIEAKVIDFPQVFIAVTDLESGVEPGKQYS